jgi:CAAX protease family protein
MKRHPLLAYLVLTFLFSWAFWVPMALASHGKAAPWFSAQRAQTLGGYGPLLAALIVTFGREGLSGARRLVGRLFIWRAGLQWYAIALLLPSFMSLLVTALHMMFGGDPPDFAHPPIYDQPVGGFFGAYNAWTILLPLFLWSLLLGTSIGEEVGWRGFALPHLQQRWNALFSSVLVGVAWGLWIWPIYAMKGGLPYYTGLLGVVPAAVLSTWIFNNTGGSLLLVTLFNNSIKVTDWFLASPVTHPVIPAVVYWTVALAVLAWWGPARLSGSELKPACRGITPVNAAPVTDSLPSVGKS